MPPTAIPVLLTFESGPNELRDQAQNWTRLIVNKLDAIGAHAVFFVQTNVVIAGTKRRLNSDGGREAIVAALPNHLVQVQTGSTEDYALHTRRAADGKLDDDLKRAVKAITDLPGGVAPEYVRAPAPERSAKNVFARNEAVNLAYENRALKHVGANIDPDDRFGSSDDLERRKAEVIAAIKKQIDAELTYGTSHLIVRLRDTSPITLKYFTEIVTAVKTSVDNFGGASHPFTAQLVASKAEALQILQNWRAYDRNAALAYGRKLWKKVASDNAIATILSASGKMPKTKIVKNVAGAEFVVDHVNELDNAFLGSVNVAPWSQPVTSGPDKGWTWGSDDCTHFVTCCLGRPPLGEGGVKGGGLKIPGDFPADCYGRLSANGTINWLRERGLVRVVAECVKTDAQGKQEAEQHVLPKLQPGDLIGYFMQSENRYGHLVMYGKDLKILCHTYARTDDDPACTWSNWALWAGNKNWQWTFMKVEDR